MNTSLMDRLERHHDQSWGWSLACCHWQSASAEDVLQEAYLRVLDGRARFGGQSSEKTWFFGVIRRVAAEQGRSQARRGVLRTLHLVEPANPASDRDTAEQGLVLDQSCLALRDALLKLSQRQREILHLVFYGELTLEEAARTTGLSLGSARTHYHRGKQRLAELLENDDEQS